jgi:hypothetical protein
MLRKLVQRLREPSSLAGLSALAMLLGQSVEDAAAWAHVAAAGLGVAAVLVAEGDQP